MLVRIGLIGSAATATASAGIAAGAMGAELRADHDTPPSYRHLTTATSDQE
ncbi:hypothetical protein [Leucobacter celer]|uniref:hypothetical protein n=1 Tax=Leucobacter celer TaxID=668625 RepID=UPI00373FDF60